MEIGFGFGPLFFLGDLGGNSGKGASFIKDINPQLTQVDKRVYFTWYPYNWIGVRLGANHGIVSGDDAVIKRSGGAEQDRWLRNLSFKSSIAEVYVAIEIYPFTFIERSDGLSGKFRPFGLAGIGLFHFNPKAKTELGDWVFLRPLRLEGQGFSEYPNRKQYKLTQVEIPLGAGFKYFFSENFYTGIEMLYRKTFTDYVDDVSTGYIDPDLFDKYLSPGNAPLAKKLFYRGKYPGVNNVNMLQDFQRGHPENNDAFFSFIFRFGWSLNVKKSEGWRVKQQTKCFEF